MSEIIALFNCLGNSLEQTILTQLQIISMAMLSMRGRITMLGLSRWTAGKRGGSYRSLQRFYSNGEIAWLSLNWIWFMFHLYDKEDVMLLAGDETTITKSGKKTHGLGRFFSSTYERAVPGIKFLNLSLVSVKRRNAYPMGMVQVIQAEKATKNKEEKPTPAKSASRSKRGRPKGCKNKDLKQPRLSAYLLWIQGQLSTVLKLISNKIQLRYFLYDGAFGNNNCMQMVQQCGLFLISKLNRNSALYLPYSGPKKTKGKSKKYGEKLNYAALDSAFLKSSNTEDNIKTDIYQLNALHKNFPTLINVCIIIKTNLKTNKQARAILFSNDISIPYDKVTDYYSLRFQIEFVFRDAKQHFGLEDFMNVTETAVHNAANLSMFMINLTQTFRQKSNNKDSLTINDIKASFHGRFYLDSVLKMIPNFLDPIFIQRLYQQIPAIGRINQQKIAA